MLESVYTAHLTIKPLENINLELYLFEIYYSPEMNFHLIVCSGSYIIIVLNIIIPNTFNENNSKKHVLEVTYF